MGFRRRLTIEILIYALIITALSVLLYFLAGTITTKTNEIASLRGQLDFWAKSTESLAGLKQDAAQASTYLPLLQSDIPSKDQLINFLPDLDVLAKENKVNLNHSLGSQQPDANYNRLTVTSFSLAAQGTLLNIINFVKAIKTSRYPIQFNAADLVRDSQGSFTMTIGGQVFSL